MRPEPDGHQLACLYPGNMEDSEARVSPSGRSFHQSLKLFPRGELKVAEVTSRFTGVDEFTSLVSSFGFKLESKASSIMRGYDLFANGQQDERNTHFALFEFKKVSRRSKAQKDISKALPRGNVLKPCEYKRR